MPATLEAALAAIRNPTARTLILCRTEPQAASVRRALARSGGALGLTIRTPARLVAELAESTPADFRAAPSSSRLLERVGRGRPKLRARLAELVRMVRRHRAAGAALPEGALWTDLTTLADAGWGRDGTDAAWERALDETTPLPDAWQFDHVYSLGFDPLSDAAAASYWGWQGADAELPAPWPAADAALVSRLDARPLLDPAGDDADQHKDIPTVAVPDVAAEARLAARLLLDVPGGPTNALVLVPDATTADRVRDACWRNDMPVASRARNSYANHALADALRAALPWFEGGAANPSIRGRDLADALTNPAVGHRRTKARSEALLAQGEELGVFDEVELPRALDEGEDPAEALRALRMRRLRLTDRNVREAIRAARIDEAPLSVWISRLEEMARKGKHAMPQLRPFRLGVVRPAALALAERLRRLGDCLRADPFGDAAAVAAAAVAATDDDALQDAYDDEPDDEPTTGRMAPPDAFLGDATPDNAPPPAGTLMAMRRFFVDGGLRVGDDPVGAALIGALARPTDPQANPGALALLLTDGAADAVLEDGVEIFTYDDVDGRDAAVVLLLGLHDKGVGALPTPDPILGVDGPVALGEPGGRPRVLLRLLAAQRAAARADTAIAIVSAHDSTGRRVSPIVELPLNHAAGAKLLAERFGLDAKEVKTGSYGLGLRGLPESADTELLKAAPVPREDGDAVSAAVESLPALNNAALAAAMARQATLEWLRLGQGPIPATDEIPDGNLDARAGAWASLVPDALGPWVGHIGEVPGTNLLVDQDGAPASWSVSSQFTPLTNCLYRLFAERVLGIREEDEVGDGLDARDIGTAIHGAIETLDKKQDDGIAWRTSEDDVERARADAVAKLGAEAASALDRTTDELGHRTDTISASTVGETARWAAHWERYAASRVRSGVDGGEMLRKRLADVVSRLAGYDDIVATAINVADAHGWHTRDRDGNFQKLLKDAVVKTVREGETGNLPSADALRRCLKIPDKKGLGVKIVEALTSTPDWTTIVEAARVALPGAREREAHVAGAVAQVLAELPFGDNADGASAATVELTLGTANRPVSVRGKIDRVMVLNTRYEPQIELLDYKTGKGMGRDKVEAQVASLQLPQLPVYALALQQLIEEGRPPEGIPPDARVAALGYDFVKKLQNRDYPQGGLIDGISIGRDELDGYRAVLGALVDRTLAGQWSLVPLDEGPMSSSFGYPKGAVSLRDASRFEGLPKAPALEDEDESDTDDDGDGGKR